MTNEMEKSIKQTVDSAYELVKELQAQLAQAQAKIKAMQDVIRAGDVVAVDYKLLLEEGGYPPKNSSLLYHHEQAREKLRQMEGGDE